MKPLERKVLFARLALFWERLWPAIFQTLMVIGAFALVTLAGLFEVLPQTLHIIVLVGFALAFLWSLRPLRSLRWPARKAALRHLELASGLPHRPASSYEDTWTGNNNDTLSRRLWLQHKKRLAEYIRGLKPGWPTSHLAKRDPYALRTALILCLVVAFASSGTEWRTRIASAFVPTAKSEVPVWLDAWVKPPAYTGMAPIFLSGQNSVDSSEDKVQIDVPTGSEIVVRVNGAEAPYVTFEYPTVTGQEPDVRDHSLGTVENDVQELRADLDEETTVTVLNGTEALESWSFRIIPDAPPRVDLVGEIERTVNEALRFIYSVSDDYGVAELSAEFVLADEQDGAIGVSSSTLLTIAPPDFPIILPSINPRTAEQMVYQDLTPHPWAGLAVEMTLIATDQAGNTARSETFTFRLPERGFSEPLARAVIEQRHALIREADSRDRVEMALDALTIYPEGLFDTSGIYLGVRHTLNSLRSDSSTAVIDTIDLMWELALAIEDGDLSLAERELRAAQRALQEALARDASPEEVAELMQRLRDAVQDYMTALIERSQRDPQTADEMQEGGQEVTPQDFDSMMDMIENLARAGANDAAQEMLAQLQSMLENMEAGRSQAGMSQRDAEMARLLQQLGELMGEQQQLMDQTFQTPDQGAAEPGASGGASSEFQELLELQDELAMTLDELLNGLERRGVEGPSSLDQAGESMQEAIDALGQADRRGAVGSQGEALDQLREGAQAMAQEMLQGNGTQGALGRHGRGNNDVNEDPLGRPLDSSGTDLGLSTEVPSEMEMQQAREILRELQERVGNQERPQLELDYLNRLLERF